MAHNKFNMNVNEVQIKIKRWTGGKKAQQRKTTCSILSGFEICSIFSQLNKSKRTWNCSPLPFSKQIAESVCSQIPSWHSRVWFWADSSSARPLDAKRLKFLVSMNPSLQRVLLSMCTRSKISSTPSRLAVQTWYCSFIYTLRQCRVFIKAFPAR